MRDGREKRRDENIGKIVAFVLATICLSLAILVPCYYFFEIISIKVKEVGIFPDAIASFWQGFALIVFFVTSCVGTLMAVLIFGEDKKHVL